MLHSMEIAQKTYFDSLLEVSYQSEAVKWCNVLKHIIDVVFFWWEGGLAFSGSDWGSKQW